jgi:MerR family transcriptional regulator, light-induced transcriptional regulator
MPSLSIGDLAERTGVPPSTLRTWELRYAIPTSRRGTGGHRRYDADAVDLVLEVIRQRAAGVSMTVAVERAKDQVKQPETSVFAGVTRRHPGLRIQSLQKPAMLALCRAIEDECCAQAERPLLFASFQRERFYRASESRWQELARTARSAIVFANFSPPSTTNYPMEIAVPFDAALNREWVLVCDAPDQPGCVVGWEPPRPSAIDGGARRFEAFWSIDPQVVRHAARVCAYLSTQYRSDVPSFEGWLADTPPASPPELRRAGAVLDRMLAYLSALSSSR